jgi:hypothetical protein
MPATARGRVRQPRAFGGAAARPGRIDARELGRERIGETALAARRLPTLTAHHGCRLRGADH